MYCHKSKDNSCIKLAYRIWLTEINFNKSCGKSLSFFNKDIK